MNFAVDEYDKGVHALTGTDTRLSSSDQIVSRPSPGASPTTPMPITKLDRLKLADGIGRYYDARLFAWAIAQSEVRRCFGAF
ncbi:MAG: hypothetical protein ACLPUG_04800 [Acidimicrobiales bacterium]|jgi:hypothetical protein